MERKIGRKKAGLLFRPAKFVIALAIVFGLVSGVFFRWLHDYTPWVSTSLTEGTSAPTAGSNTGTAVTPTPGQTNAGLNANQLLQRITDAVSGETTAQESYNSIPAAQLDGLTFEEYQRYISLIDLALTLPPSSYSPMSVSERDRQIARIVKVDPNYREVAEQSTWHWLETSVNDNEGNFAIALQKTAGGLVYLDNDWVTNSIDLYDYAQTYFGTIIQDHAEVLSAMVFSDSPTAEIRLAKANAVLDFYSEYEVKPESIQLTAFDIASINYTITATRAENPEPTPTVSETSQPAASETIPADTAALTEADASEDERNGQDNVTVEPGGISGSAVGEGQGTAGSTSPPEETSTTAGSEPAPPGEPGGLPDSITRAITITVSQGGAYIIRDSIPEDTGLDDFTVRKVERKLPLPGESVSARQLAELLGPPQEFSTVAVDVPAPADGNAEEGQKKRSFVFAKYEGIELLLEAPVIAPDGQDATGRLVAMTFTGQDFATAAGIHAETRLDELLLKYEFIDLNGFILRNEKLGLYLRLPEMGHAPVSDKTLEAVRIGRIEDEVLQLFENWERSGLGDAGYFSANAKGDKSWERLWGVSDTARIRVNRDRPMDR